MNIQLHGGPLKEGEFEIEEKDSPMIIELESQENYFDCYYILERLNNQELHYRYLGKDE
jgi:hypothetical protein